MTLFFKRYGIIFLALFFIFIAIAILRPILPIDETRYLTVAWEMYVNQEWFLLTKNFEPYHHKPPLLFWLINVVWSIFGISRWAAMIPLYLAACACLVLCHKLAQKLLPEEVADRVPLLLLGSVPFVIYSGMIMFDVTMMAFVLACMLAMLSLAQKRKIITIVIMGLFLGLGVLTKGPVAYLYVLPAMLLAPFWFSINEDKNKVTWYTSILAVILISLIPVLAWLVPTLTKVDHDFATTLIWNQSAGRISGSLNNAHSRPVYFYLLLAPILALPWAFIPSFWRTFRQTKWPRDFRFLLCWFIPVFIGFSFISGKQPHYLVPVLPAVIIAIAWLLRDTSYRSLMTMTFCTLSVFVIGHVIAYYSLFKNYDLQPVSSYIITHPDKDVAFAGEYHGEFGFLARMTKPVQTIEREHIGTWLQMHQNGMVILPYKKELSAAEQKHELILSMPYRGRLLAIME